MTKARKQHQPPSDAPSYRGVSWHRYSARWRVKIRFGGNCHLNLGYYKDPHEAARAYDYAVRLSGYEEERCNFDEPVLPPPGVIEKLQQVGVF